VPLKHPREKAKVSDMKSVNFLVVGVGGQGTVLTGDILAEVGMTAGFDSKKSDVLGLAVRSGSVISHIRWGEKVNAPMSMKGTVDYLLAFEPLEALRMTEYLDPNSTAIVNEYRIPPAAVTTGQVGYPEIETIKKALADAAQTVYYIDATEKAKELGNVKAVNILLLGALSSLFEISPQLWEEVITKYVPDRFLDLNLRAFQAGRELIGRNSV
jgi:indolepyruvate ferredoxin oxidoreductase beta subunit